MRKLIFKAQAKNIIAVFLIMSLLTAILFIALAAIGGAIGYAVNLSYARSAPSYAHVLDTSVEIGRAHV